ncbi:MAG: DsrE family protein [Ectothiorhodospiraceae bacterium]|nr:DsrE family protein [Ectothiorhodospiraceae bacterium]
MTSLLTSLRFLLILLLVCLPLRGMAELEESAELVATPYADEQKVVYDFFFDHPQKINSALYWLKGLMEPLTAEPYNLSTDDIDIKVIIHGTEIVAFAKDNYPQYKEAVQRMEYYAQLGVEFRVCGITASIYGYQLSDLQDFVLLVPSGVVELVHWQNQGYALITPRIQEKNFSIDEIR